MEQQILTTMTPQDIINLVKTGIREFEKEKESQETKNRSYSINQVAKELGRSHTTIKRLIIDGKLQTTADGKRIPVQVLNNYLKTG